MSQPINEIEQRKQQTQLIMKLFELWQLTDKEKAIALGLSPGTQTSIYKYKTGKQYLPSTRDTQDRIGHLLAIHKFLRRAYPFDKELAYQWIKTPNMDFNSRTPFDLISQNGYLGLIQIRYYLEMNEHQQSGAGDQTIYSASFLDIGLLHTPSKFNQDTFHSHSTPPNTQSRIKKINRN